jgi:hypothetical protein
MYYARDSDPNRKSWVELDAKRKRWATHFGVLPRLCSGSPQNVAEQRGQKFPPSPNATDGFFPNEQGLAAADALEREAIHRYNNRNGINYGYWQWDGDSGQWLTMPAANPNLVTSTL